MLIQKYGYHLPQTPNQVVGRVICRKSNFYEVVFLDQIHTIQVTGKFKNETKSLPVVGDFVILEKSDATEIYRIVGLMPRKSAFSRKPAVSGGRKIRNGRIVGGSTEEQVIAANIDVAFIVSDLYKDFNRMRLERYVAAAKSGGMKPVVILNKLDLCDEPERMMASVKEIDAAIEVLAISVLKNIGIDALRAYFKKGETVVFLGSSGVGKSSIMNLIFGENRQMTKNINMGTGKGQHTTTSGELFLHESGCLLIDTPGMRELTLWCEESEIDEVYEDIVSIMENCRFNDCKHDKEPGCAIRIALETGALNRAHYESYLKLMGDAKVLKNRKTQKEIYEARVKKRGQL